MNVIPEMFIKIKLKEWTLYFYNKGEVITDNSKFIYVKKCGKKFQTWYFRGLLMIITIFTHEFKSKISWISVFILMDHPSYIVVYKS